jgi:hypothetical protein
MGETAEQRSVAEPAYSRVSGRERRIARTGREGGAAERCGALILKIFWAID